MSLQDLSRNTSRFSYKNVKAYPSINSVNGGSINDEEALRWIVKRFTNKPFIVGFNDEEITSAFSGTGGGNGRYPYSGMMNIDGYLVKMADQSHISFDDNTRTRISDESTLYVQRFIETMFSDTRSIETEYYSVFDKSKTPSYATYWKVLNPQVKNRVGYVNVFYSNDLWDDINEQFADKLNELTTQYKKDYNGGETSIPIVNVAKKSISYELIYGNTENVNGTISPMQTFTDIFELTFTLKVSRNDTRQYPATCDRNISMFEDTNISSAVSVSDPIQLSTIDSIYDYTHLYNSGYIRLNKTDSYDASAIKNDIINSGVSAKDALESVFDEVSFSNNRIKELNRFTYELRYSDIKYYCIKSDSKIDGQLSIDGKLVPISLMCSTGEMTPFGAFGSVTDADQSKYYNSGFFTSYPVDGYLTWLKRYCYKNKHQDVELEKIEMADINAVTLEELIADTECMRLYNLHVVPAINLFLQMSYSALGDKSLGFLANTSSKYKSLYSGSILANNSSISKVSDDDFAVTVNAKNPKKCVCSTVGSTKEVSEVPVVGRTVLYSKDKSTDRFKLNSGVSVDYVVDRNAGVFDVTPITDGDITTYSDPLNYLRNCVTQRDTETHISTFPVMKLNKVNGVYSIDNIGDNYVLNNVRLNDMMFPIVSLSAPMYSESNKTAFVSLPVALALHASVTEGNRSNTGCNGLNYSYDMLSWQCAIPYVAKVYKDSQGWLNGRDASGTDEYTGVRFEYVLPQDVNADDLKILDLYLSTVNQVKDFDIETTQVSVDSSSRTIKHNKESIIHFSKLYGDMGETLDEHIDAMSETEIYENYIVYPDLPQNVLNIQNNHYYNMLNYGSSPVERVDVLFNTDEKASTLNIRDDNVIKEGMTFTIRTNRYVTQTLAVKLVDTDGTQIDCRFNIGTTTDDGYQLVPISTFYGDVELLFRCVRKSVSGSTSKNKYVFDVFVRDYASMDGNVIEPVEFAETSSTINKLLNNTTYVANHNSNDVIYAFDATELELVSSGRVSKSTLLLSQRYYFDETNPLQDKSLKVRIKADSNVNIDSEHDYFVGKSGNFYTICLNPYNTLYRLGSNTSASAPSVMYKLDITVANNMVSVTINEEVSFTAPYNYTTQYKSIEASNAYEIINARTFLDTPSENVYEWLTYRRKNNDFTNIAVGDYLTVNIAPNEDFVQPVSAKAVICGINHNGSNTIDFIFNKGINLYGEVYMAQEGSQKIIATQEYIDQYSEATKISSPVIVNNAPYIYSVRQSGDIVNNSTTDNQDAIIIGDVVSTIAGDYVSNYRTFVPSGGITVSIDDVSVFIDSSFGEGEQELVQLTTSGTYKSDTAQCQYYDRKIIIYVDRLPDEIKTKLRSGKHTTVIYAIGSSNGGFCTNSNAINYLNGGFVKNTVCIPNMDGNNVSDAFKLSTTFNSLPYVNSLIRRLPNKLRDAIINAYNDDKSKSVMIINSSSANYETYTQTGDTDVIHYPEKYVSGTFNPHVENYVENSNYAKTKLPPLWIPFEQELFGRTFQSDEKYTQPLNQYPLFKHSTNPITEGIEEGVYFTASPIKDSFLGIVVAVKGKGNNVMYSDTYPTEVLEHNKALVGFSL